MISKEAEIIAEDLKLFSFILEKLSMNENEYQRKQIKNNYDPAKGL